MNNDFPEAPAVIFTNYKRPDGFEVSLTFRGENGTALIEKMEKAIEYLKENGCTPVVKYSPQTRQNAIQDTKMCKEHNIPMRGKISKKTGNKYYSHSQKNINDKWETCFGSGYQEQDY